MSLLFNSSTIADSASINFNGTSVDQVKFDSTTVWRKTVTYSDTRTWCIDHYLYVKYDGNGNVEIAGAEPSGNVHTGRGDCGGHGQGWYTAVTFNKTDWTNVRIQVSSSNGSYDNTRSVNSSLGNTTVATYGSSGAQAPSITVTVTLTF